MYQALLQHNLSPQNIWQLHLQLTPTPKIFINIFFPQFGQVLTFFLLEILQSCKLNYVVTLNAHTNLQLLIAGNNSGIQEPRSQKQLYFEKIFGALKGNFSAKRPKRG